MRNPLLPHVLATVLLLSASEALAGERPVRWAVPVPNAAIGNLFRVEPDLFRSSQPSAAGFREIQNLGIKTVLNLRAGHEDTKAAAGTSVTLLRIPMRAWRLRDDQLLPALRHLIDRERRPLLVHCQHGADRTGGVLAMYRIVVQGWSKPDALEEMTDGGFGFHGIWKNIVSYVEKADVERWRRDLGVPARP
jgi:protein tyrosine/serine phosphatase